MSQARIIEHTTATARHPWPEGCFVQGGDAGVVFRKGTAYRTAFVEAFPQVPPTFLRGEGPTIAEAEDACWQAYLRYAACEHGEFERRGYTNGAGFCGRCGTFLPNLFATLPAGPRAQASLLERALTGDAGAALTIATAVADVENLPPAPPENGGAP